LLVTVERINGSPSAPNPGALPFTILAMVGIVWGLKKDKSENK
jgi:hypothetical protein